VRVLAAIGAAVVAIAAVAVWIATRGSAGGVQVPQIPPALRAATPPPPPHGALVLARGHGDLAVAIAARRAAGELRLTTTVIAPDGTGLSGLQVGFAADGTKFPAAKACGAGCYSSAAPLGARVARVTITLSGRGRPASTMSFALPEHWPVSAAPLLRGTERVFERLRSVVYHERLASGPRVTNTSVWRSEAPDRLTYRSASGDAGVIVGRRRWDLVLGGGWKRGLQNPPLDVPAPPWGRGVYDVYLLDGGRLGGREVVRFSMFDPSTPAWYTVTLDRRTLRPVTVQMTATAHFMQDRYVAFNTPRQIRPPVAP
jgi:hypothetical protein